MQFSLIPRLLLCFYVFIFISTETLSSFNLLSREYILPLDIIFLAILFFFLKEDLIKLIAGIKFKSKFSISILFLFLLTFLQGLISAPSTTDSMVYHIPRIMYWIQEKTLFQTVVRGSHDFMAPFSEYLTLHLYFITGNDYLLFFSQWLAYVACVALSVLIAAKFLKAKTRLIYVGVLAASLPIAVLQSSSTQTDLVTTVFVLLSIYYAFCFKDTPNIKNAAALGLSLGLGVLTKASFVIYSLIPAGIILIALIERRKSLFKTIIPLFLTAVLALILQVRFFSQNLLLFGNISGQAILEKGSGYTNESISLSSTTSNLIRNSFLNIPIPIINNQVGEIIYNLHNLVGIQTNDPQTTYSGTYFKVPPVIFPQEDIAASPLHFVLIIIAGIYLVINRRNLKKYDKNLLYLYGLSVLSFIFFSAVLKWQPFHPRLLIPFLLIGSISSFVILETSEKLKRFLKIFLVVSLLLAFALSLLNISRPYISYSIFYKYISQYSQQNASIPKSFFAKPRQEQYFNSRYYWNQPYVEILSNIEPGGEDKNIAFHLMDEFEYPFWILLKDKNINFKIVPYSEASDSTVIITTSENPFQEPGFETICSKTDIDYGYACISIKNK